MSIIYGCSDPEFVGVFPVRQDIEVLPADPIPDIHDQIVITPADVTRKALHHFGFTVTETIGVGVINPKGIWNAEIVLKGK